MLQFQNFRSCGYKTSEQGSREERIQKVPSANVFGHLSFVIFARSLPEIAMEMNTNKIYYLFQFCFCILYFMFW